MRIIIYNLKSKERKSDVECVKDDFVNMAARRIQACFRDGSVEGRKREVRKARKLKHTEERIQKEKQQE